MKTRLLRYLRRNASEDGTWFGSKEDVAAALNVTLSPVQKAFAALVREGKFRVVSKGGGRGRCTVYALAGSPPAPLPRDGEEKGVQTVFHENGVPPTDVLVQNVQSFVDHLTLAALHPPPQPSRPTPTQARPADTVSPAPQSVPNPPPPWPPRVVEINPFLRWELAGTAADGWTYSCTTGGHAIGSVRVFRQRDGTLGYLQSEGLGLVGGFPAEASPEKLVAHLKRIAEGR